MKKLIYNLIGLSIVGLALSSCVDDYQDANPEPQMDGPATYLSYIGDEFVATNNSDDEFTYLENGGQAVFEISVVDAPGLIDSVSVSLSNIQRPDAWGTATVEGFSAIQGETSGTFTVVYDAPTLVDEPFNFANENIIINVYDAQDPRKIAEIIEIPTIRTTRSDCFASTDLTGLNPVVSSGFDGAAGGNYTDLEADIDVYFRETEHPGIYFLTDATFGLYGAQGYSPVIALINVCDNDITFRASAPAGEFVSFSGTINPEASTATFEWETIYGDTGTSVMSF